LNALFAKTTAQHQHSATAGAFLTRAPGLLIGGALAPARENGEQGLSLYLELETVAARIG
jgi:hypothetical protein